MAFYLKKTPPWEAGTPYPPIGLQRYVPIETNSPEVFG